MSCYELGKMLEWTYSGVDHTLPGNGGEECINFIPTKQKIFETILFTSIGMMEIRFGLTHLKLPNKLPQSRLQGDRLGKRIILTFMCIIFGIELGFKFATKQMIWILNPCHIVTMAQVR